MREREGGAGARDNAYGYSGHRMRERGDGVGVHKSVLGNEMATVNTPLRPRVHGGHFNQAFAFDVARLCSLRSERNGFATVLLVGAQVGYKISRQLTFRRI